MNARDEKGKARRGKGKEEKEMVDIYKSLACGQPFVTSMAKGKGGEREYKGEDGKRAAPSRGICL